MELYFFFCILSLTVWSFCHNTHSATECWNIMLVAHRGKAGIEYECKKEEGFFHSFCVCRNCSLFQNLGLFSINDRLVCLWCQLCWGSFLLVVFNSQSKCICYWPSLLLLLVVFGAPGPSWPQLEVKICHRLYDSNTVLVKVAFLSGYWENLRLKERLNVGPTSCSFCSCKARSWDLSSLELRKWNPSIMCLD